MILLVETKNIKSGIPETDSRIQFIGKEDRTSVNPNTTTTSDIVRISSTEVIDADNTVYHYVSSSVKGPFDTATAKVQELTGQDITTRFGDVKRDLQFYGGSSGSGNITWHKTGRAIDLNQGYSWTIRYDDQGNDMYFILYLPLSADLAETIDQSPDKKYVETFTTADKDSFKTNPKYNTKLVNVTHILEDNGFSRIKAHSNWKTSWSGQEWWHYEMLNNQTMYQSLREVHTEQEIVTNYGVVVRNVPKTRRYYESRFIREGFPSYIVKAFYPQAVSFGQFSLFLSVGEHTEKGAKDVANFPDDLAATETILAQFGYPVVNAVNILQQVDIDAIKDVSTRLLKKEQSAILVGDALHKKIGETAAAPVTKTNLELFAAVGQGQANLPLTSEQPKKHSTEGSLQGNSMILCRLPSLWMRLPTVFL